jgi:hypothetical protein
MKKRVSVLCLCISTAFSYAQTGSLPDPLFAPPANSSFYYENQGQIIDQSGAVRNDIKYYTEHAYPSLALREGSISFWDYAFGDTTVTPAPKDTLRRIDMAFVCNNQGNNGQPCGTIKKYGVSNDHLNYYLPHCGPTGITNVKGYERIVYENVFPNINFHLYSNSRGSKYYFEVKPGGNPANIRLLFSGQDSITAISSSLQMYLGQWQLVFPVAYAYQIGSGSTTTMLGWSPTWVHSGGGNITLSTGTFDPSKTLVIGVGPGIPLSLGESDENLDWSVYYGDVGEEEGGRMDPYGDAVFHGMTIYNRNFPVAAGETLDTASTEDGDWYISKFIDTRRQWGTYYGGTKREELAAVKCGNNYLGDVWVGGSTYSNNVISGPTVPTGCFKQAFNAGSSSGKKDGLIASFRNTTGVLVFNTYFGSAAEEEIRDIVVASNHPSVDHLYIVGSTGLATTFINSSSAQTTGKYPVYAASPTYYFKGTKSSPSDYDGFIARFELTNFKMDWSTLFGGDGVDFISTAEIRDGSLYVGGLTESTKMDQYPSPTSSHLVDRFPLSKKTGAFFQNSTENIFERSAFISHFKNETLNLDWSTLLGYSTTGTTAIKFNSTNDVYALIQNSYSSEFAPSSTLGNPHGKIPTYNSGSSYYETSMSNRTMGLLKFSSAYALTWGTSLHSIIAGGGSWGIPAQRGGMTIDENDVVYVATLIEPATAPTFFLSGSYWQDENAATSVAGAIDGNLTDNYILGFDKTNQLKWSSFFGGASTVLGSDDEPTDLITHDGYLYLTGTTLCPTSPYTYWPYFDSYQDDTYAPGQDVFISRFKTKIATTGIDNHNAISIGLNVYPNPVSDVFNISFVNDGSLKVGETLKIVCTDVLGKVLAETEWKVSSGANRFNMDIRGVAAGTYFISLSGAGVQSSAKVIKL